MGGNGGSRPRSFPVGGAGPSWREDPLHRHRVWACEIAAVFGGADVIEALQMLATDPDGHVRRTAEHALAAVRGS